MPAAGPQEVPTELDQPEEFNNLDLMWSREDLARATPSELADLAETSMQSLAQSEDPTAFAHLLRLTRVAGECLGIAARTLAHERSWSQVADIAGTTRQAAWERWRDR
jgi:hypothetical protein